MALQHLRSSTAHKRPVPGNMSDGQLGINTNLASPGLFFKDTNGDLVKVGPVHVGTTAPNASPAAGGTAGNSVGEQWLDTTGGTYVFKVWDGSAWRSESGTFVDVNGDVMTGALGIIAGSDGSPGLYFSGDTNTGIYSPGADQVAISTNGAQALYINADGDILVADGNRMEIDEIRARDGAGLKLYDDAGAGIFIQDGGNVGLGTSTPGTILDARGIISVGSSSLANAVIQKSAVPGGSYNLTITAGGGLTSESATTPTDALAGSVIKLLGGDPATDTFGGGIQYYANGSTSPNGAGVGNQHVFYTRSATNTYTERVRIDASGRLGVGTTSPTASLHVSGDDFVRITRNSKDLSINANYSAGNDKAQIQADTGMSLAFATNGDNERGRFDSSGRLLVGTASDSGGALLQVNGDRIRVGTAKTPASATATGTAGEICWDADYVYVCTATNTWKRTAIATW